MDFEHTSSSSGDESDVDSHALNRRTGVALPKFAEADRQFRDDSLWVPEKSRYASTATTGTDNVDEDSDASAVEAESDDDGTLPNFAEFDVVDFGSDNDDGDDDASHKTGDRFNKSESVKQIELLENEEEQFKLYNTTGNTGTDMSEYRTPLEDYCKDAAVEGVKSQLKLWSDLVMLRGEMQPLLTLLQRELPTSTCGNNTGGIITSTGGIITSTGGIITSTGGIEDDAVDGGSVLALPASVREGARSLFASVYKLHDDCSKVAGDNIMMLDDHSTPSEDIDTYSNDYMSPEVASSERRLWSRTCGSNRYRSLKSRCVTEIDKCKSLTEPMVRKTFIALDQSVRAQVTTALRLNSERLWKRSLKDSKASDPQQGNNTTAVHHVSTAGQLQQHYIDTDFYANLLKSTVDDSSRTAMTNTQNESQRAFKSFLDQVKLRRVTRQRTTYKASKGRNIKYAPVPALQNFVNPTPTFSPFEDSTVDLLMASIFAR